MKRLATTAFGSAWNFLNWWIAELNSTFEDLRAHLSPRWRRSLTVYVSRSHLQFKESDLHRSATVLELTRTQWPRELPKSQQAAIAVGRRARLVFNAEFAFVRSVRMPSAALPHLASAMELQLPKLLPIDPALLRSDFEITAMDPNGAWVDIDLAAVRRSDIEPIENAVRQWGLQPGSVHLGNDSEPRPRFKFAATDAQVNRLAVTRNDLLLAAGAATLTVCAIAVFAVQAVRAHRALELALVQTSAQATLVLEQRQQLIARLETLSLISKAERMPTAAAILAEVTNRLNRDAWLTTFELKGRDLRLVGWSAEPAAIVKELTSSALITEVQLRSSMAGSTHSGKDRFEITAQVKAGT